MAEFIYNEVQQVEGGQAAVLNDAIPCNHQPQLVVHRAGSGILTLRGIVANQCAAFARYKVMYDANIAVPESGTPGEIQTALAIGGEVVPTSIAAVTPTVAQAYFNVAGFAIIDVPKGCCYTVSVENATTADTAIEMRNLNVEVTRLA